MVIRVHMCDYLDMFTSQTVLAYVCISVSNEQVLFLAW